MSRVTDVMSPALGRIRGYFAPVDRVAGRPTIFDPAMSGSFALDSPPASWIDLGWITGFARQSGTKVEAIRTGAPASTQIQVRSEVDASVSFSFESWGKLQLALAGGAQQMNLLKPAAGSAAAGSGGAASAATPLVSGSTAAVLQAGVGSAGFSVGELVAVDVDYTGQVGFLGSGVSGAYVRAALSDVDYVRRITLNVGRIAAISNGALTLESALIGGVPAAGMKISAVAGFCDREGSSFFQEWSGLFVGEGQQGERVIWHYPRLQAMESAAESLAPIASGIQKARLSGSFRALKVEDAVDGDGVVCFRSYLPG